MGSRGQKEMVQWGFSVTRIVEPGVWECEEEGFDKGGLDQSGQNAVASLDY